MKSSYPQRIVCLAAEAPEILARLGAWDQVVGVSSFAQYPEAVREKPRIGGFSTPDLGKVLGLQPDLVIAISDIQAQIAADLVRAGVPVLVLNPHHLVDVWRNILLVGGAAGLQREAEALVKELQDELAALRDRCPLSRRLRVFFEEWPEPLISGIGWVGELIAYLGGEDLFPELSARFQARERVVSLEEVARRQPEVIVASWCGKKADLEAIRSRPAWQGVPAVQQGQVYEIASSDILQAGPGLIRGAGQLQRLLAGVAG